ncbi:Complex I intermediate-associated protein 84, mitochondrial [Acrodontium crateriforme]|uniref:Complex I intermediate-associated protein 84, mitochondrial n=1 Tax=Acrodontium crateriforme TaxID=150365 RepID=A0AAQ3R9H1_9PEZI|nr:Complex I intermediate-associated protein 84, mitochondrial [Acrodontium crateriforme]
MPSHLTRHVFRRLLANKPIVHHGCLRRNALIQNSQTIRSKNHEHGLCLEPGQQCRTFLDFKMFRAKGKDKQAVADIDPGVDVMMGLARRQNMRARLPEAEDVAEALIQFFGAKRRQNTQITDTQADLASKSLEFCQAAKAPLDVSKHYFKRIISPAANVLLIGEDKRSDAHVRLAKLLIDIAHELHPRSVERELRTYCKVLCYAGLPEEAQKVLSQYSLRKVGTQEQTMTPSESEDPAPDDVADVEGEKSSFSIPTKTSNAIWTYILSSLGQLGREKEFQEALQQARAQDFHVMGLSQILLEFHVRQRNMSEIEQCWNDYRLDVLESSGSSLSHPKHGAIILAVLKLCAQNSKIDLGHAIVRDLLNNSPPKQIWDAIFVWGVATGKGPDEIGRMFDVMEKTNQHIADKRHWRRPDAATINELVEYAISKNDPYMAERFITLGRDRNILPDARTYVLQINYRLDVDDVDGALTAYKNLQGQDVSSKEDVPAVNRLIVALCNSQRHDFDTIMNVAADLSDRRARFEPSTVTTLSLLHLTRDEVHDVVDLLNTHAFQFSAAERSQILEALIKYCQEPSTDVTLSWDTYSLSREIFDEMPRGPRTSLMVEFFNRGRSDMAVNVFNHMRAHSRPDTMPIDETYISAFLGAAKQQDLDSLEVLHNQLKLDYNIDVTTRIRNALLIAYTACGQPREALGFWDEMCASREGPSYESIHSALRACEKSTWGDKKAQKIWSTLRSKKIELDRDIWASYAGALIGNGDIALATQTLEKAEGEQEVEIDAFIAASLFMAAPGQAKQMEVETWIKERQDGIWEEIEKIGIEELENGTRIVAIDRTVSP